jgi:hypothetical protein
MMEDIVLSREDQRNNKYHVMHGESCMTVRFSGGKVIVEPCISRGPANIWDGARQVNGQTVKVIVSPHTIMPEEFDV